MSFAQIETALIDRLKADVPNLRGVFSGDDLSALLGEDPPAPCLGVFLQDYQVVDGRSDGKMAQVKQTWVVVSVIKTVAPAGQVAGAAARRARQRGGEMLDAVAASLMGFKPAGDSGPLILTTAPVPSYQNGIAYLALAFTIDSYFKGVQS